MHEEPSLIPNLTIFIQMGIFFASWAVLHFLVFRPYVALIKLRKEKTVGLLEKADRDRAEAVQLQEKYDTFMKAERKKIVAWTDDERKKINEAERQTVSEAREAMGKELHGLREKIRTETDKARKELLPQVGEYSSNIVSKLVGYAVKVPASVEPKPPKDLESTVRS